MPVAFQITLLNSAYFPDALFSKLTQKLTLIDKLLIEVFLYNLTLIDQKERLRLQDPFPERRPKS